MFYLVFEFSDQEELSGFQLCEQVNYLYKSYNVLAISTKLSNY